MLWTNQINFKRQQNIFSQTQQYIILFYLDDDVFRSPDHHQGVFTQLRIRYVQSDNDCQVAETIHPQITLIFNQQMHLHK